jgi:hypothetical protein
MRTEGKEAAPDGRHDGSDQVRDLFHIEPGVHHSSPRPDWNALQRPLLDENEPILLIDDHPGEEYTGEEYHFNDDLLSEGLIAIGEFAEKNPVLVRRRINCFNKFVTQFCDVHNWNPWVFSFKLLKHYGAWLYTQNTNLQLHSSTTAFNYVYHLHGLDQAWRGEEVTKYKVAYHTAMLARRGGSDNPPAFFRVELEVQALLLLLETAETAIGLRNDECAAMACFQIIMLWFWLRADSIGAFVGGDLTWTDSGYTVLQIRKVKTGQARVKPFTKIIPCPGTETAIVTRVTSILKSAVELRTDDGRHVLDASTWGITSKSASPKINAWMKIYMPNNLTGVGLNSFLSSHSYRRTGASHAWCSCRAHFCRIMSWGGWASISSAERYCVRTLTMSTVWTQLFFFLAPNFDEYEAVVNGPLGWYDSNPESRRSHSAMAGVTRHRGS